MADDTTPHVGIETRPFLGDLLASEPATPNAIPSIPASAAYGEVSRPSRPTGNAHLFAAATGSPLHLVEDPLPESQPDRIDPAVTPDVRPRRATRPQAHAQLRARPSESIDWRQVDSFMKELSVDTDNTRSRQDFDVATASAGPETEHEELVYAEIKRLIEAHVQWLAVQFGPDAEWTQEIQQEYVQAVFDTAFRYGRFQQYLREEDVEDISIVGYDNVMVTKSNGLREHRRPCADSDEDLERMISNLASWRGRAFSRPNGHLDLDIGGARFSATGKPITSVPNVTMRKHNYVDVGLEDLVDLETITPRMQTLLSALVRASVSGLVSGWTGTGKTTFLRAWTSAMEWDEKIVTIETEHELYLGKQKHRHSQVQDFQYLPSNLSGSDMVATYSLEDAFRESLRSSAKIILFGEIRGAEGPIAIKAMQAGKGSISTIHARNADDALHRFADILMSEQGLSDDTVPLR
jgi:pilus assembly protein CpaF